MTVVWQRGENGSSQKNELHAYVPLQISTFSKQWKNGMRQLYKEITLGQEILLQQKHQVI